MRENRGQIAVAETLGVRRDRERFSAVSRSRAAASRAEPHSLLPRQLRFRACLFARRGLLPLSAVLDGLWAQLRDLAPEVAADRFAALREGLEDGRIEALTYKLRVDTHDDGPNGVLVRDILMKARLYGSSEFVRIPEIIEDICLAARRVLQVDLESRFERASTPCIVEFAAPPHETDKALTAACWYAEATLRGEPAGGDGPFWNFDGQGVAVPPQDIFAVEILSVQR